jgi:hypothetical protein
LRRPDANVVKVNLLPHTEATVTEHGLKLFGCYYTCKEAIDWGWFEGNYHGPKKVTVAYDLYSANCIFIRPSDTYSSFVEASLTERSRAYRNLTIWEVWEQNNVRANIAATSKLKSRAGSVNLVNDLEEIAKRSKATKPIVSKMSKAEKVKGITDNKRLERQKERQNKPSPRIESSNNEQPDNVTSLNTATNKRKSFKLPTSMQDLLKGDKGDE